MVDIIVVPNPSNGEISLLVPSSFEQKSLSVEIFSQEGGRVYQEGYSGRSINVSHLASGVYLLIVKENGVPRSVRNVTILR